MVSTAVSRSKDVYELGDVPDVGVVPPRMLAQVIRAERFGEPRDAFKQEALPIPELGPRDVLVYVMAAGVNYNNVWAAMGVPIDVIKPVLGDFIANGRSTSKPRPWIGVSSQEVQGNLIVTRVSPEGPADDAGIKAGDIIVGIGGEPIKGQADFYTRLWKSGDAGTEVAVDVLKGNRVESHKIKTIDRNRYFRTQPTL